MKKFDIRDLLGGILLAGLGSVVAMYAGSHYQMGELSRMGPGYIPVALGVILAMLGIVIALLSFKKIPQVLQPPPFRMRPLAAILVSISVFALTVTRWGLVPATLLLVVIASRAEKDAPWMRTFVLGLALAALAWLIFVAGLQMSLPAFAFTE